ncbi:MAG: hypothetical protein NWP79_04405 [Paracoccaceae bacterium]|nr:hypothetical protein [Paracoccaceae bacterium]
MANTPRVLRASYAFGAGGAMEGGEIGPALPVHDWCGIGDPVVCLGRVITGLLRRCSKVYGNREHDLRRYG